MITSSKKAIQVLKELSKEEILKKYVDLQKINKTKDSEIKALVKENDKYKSLNKCLLAEKESMSKKIQCADNRIKKLQDLLAEAGRQKHELSQEKHTQMVQLKIAMNKLDKDVEHAKNDNQRLKSKADILQRKVNFLTAENNRLVKEDKENALELTSLKSSYNKLHSQFTDLAAKYSDETTTFCRKKEVLQISYNKQLKKFKNAEEKIEKKTYGSGNCSKKDMNVDVEDIIRENRRYNDLTKQQKHQISEKSNLYNRLHSERDQQKDASQIHVSNQEEKPNNNKLKLNDLQLLTQISILKEENSNIKLSITDLQYQMQYLLKVIEQHGEIQKNNSKFTVDLRQTKKKTTNFEILNT